MLVRLEARRDLVRLKEHCFWMMWVYLGAAEFGRCVAICDRGLELATQLGSAPVQYGSIKAIALARCGRFDEVEAALAQEITDDDHPFGHAIARLARTEYLATVGALEQAAAEGVAAFHEATMVSRRWMQQWLVDLLTSVRVRLERQGRPVPSSLSDLLDDSPIRRSVPARAEVELGRRSPRRGARPCSSRSWPGSRARDGSASCSRPGSSTRRRRSPTATPPARSVRAAPRSPLRWTLATRRSPGGCASCWHSPPRRRGTRRRPRSNGLVRPTEFRALRDRITDPALRTAFEHSGRAGRSRSSELIAHLAEHGPQRLHPRLAGPVVARPSTDWA